MCVRENKLLSPVGVALGVVISTVIVGFLILLIWKILTMIHDKREYAKFEKERALAKWDRVSRYSPIVFDRAIIRLLQRQYVGMFQGENPLYKQATSTFSNPTFNARY